MARPSLTTTPRAAQTAGIVSSCVRTFANHRITQRHAPNSAARIARTAPTERRSRTAKEHDRSTNLANTSMTGRAEGTLTPRSGRQDTVGAERTSFDRCDSDDRADPGQTTPNPPPRRIAATFHASDRPLTFAVKAHTHPQAAPSTILLPGADPAPPETAVWEREPRVQPKKQYLIVFNTIPQRTLCFAPIF